MPQILTRMWNNGKLEHAAIARGRARRRGLSGAASVHAGQKPKISHCQLRMSFVIWVFQVLRWNQPFLIWIGKMIPERQRHVDMGPIHRVLSYSRDVLTICEEKSTYVRCGILVNVTPFEPGWEGFATLEIANTTPLRARVYANEGLCRILFFRSDEVCEIGYADRKRKYQKQQGIALPKFWGIASAPMVWFDERCKCVRQGGEARSSPAQGPVCLPTWGRARCRRFAVSNQSR